MDPFRTPGAFSWNELATSDVEAALAFYRELFGWTSEPMAMGDGTYHVVKAAGTPVGGVMAIPAEGGAAQAAWTSYVTVEDLEAIVRKASALGGVVAYGPKDIPGVGRFALIVDPQGAAIAAISYAKR